MRKTQKQLFLKLQPQYRNHFPVNKREVGDRSRWLAVAKEHAISMCVLRKLLVAINDTQSNYLYECEQGFQIRSVELTVLPSFSPYQA